MAAVAGSVAETVLDSMVKDADLRRAYVNNGGDIAIHLTEGERFKMAMAGHDARVLGQIDIGHDDAIRGVATSGRRGRSMSMGIADSVSVLAKSASLADISATLIANAVDVPESPAISRSPANSVDEGSDLGDQLVVTGCGELSIAETDAALARGAVRARQFAEMDLISGACLFLNERSLMVGNNAALAG